MISSPELRDLLKKIVLGSQQVETAEVATLTSRQLEISLPHEATQVVLLLDGVQAYVHTLRLKLRNPDLKHILALVTDASELRWLLESAENRDLLEGHRLEWGFVSMEKGIPLEEYQQYWTGKEAGLRLHLFTDPQKDSSGVRELYSDLEIKHRYVVANRTAWGGSVEDEYIGFKNSLMNVPHFLQRPDFRNWQKGFEDRPVFVIGAGPSLDAEVEWIRRFQDRAIVIAADTLYRKLSEAQIYPHIFVSLERVSLVAALFQAGKWNRSILVGPQVMPPEAFSFFSGPQAIFMVPHLWNAFFNFRRLVMSTGNSCVGVGLALANVLSKKAVYLFGIDLCFGDDLKSHSRFSPYQSEDFAQAGGAIDEWRRDSLPVLNRAGKTVRTHFYWLRFREDFENIIKNSKAQVFVTSQAGLPLQGSKQISYAQLESQLLEFSSFDAYESLSSKLPYDRHAEAQTELKLFQANLKRLEEVVLTHRNLLDAPKSQWELSLLSLPFGSEVLVPIFKSGFLKLKSGVPELEEGARTIMQNVWRELPQVLQVARQKLEGFNAERLY